MQKLWLRAKQKGIGLFPRKAFGHRSWGLIRVLFNTWYTSRFVRD